MIGIRQVQEISARRSHRWHHADTEPWSGADWSNAMAGEAGEACNAVKKMRRVETNTVGGHNGHETDVEALRAKIGEELADTFLYAVLVADHYGIDLESAVAAKFNLVSEENGFPERLS